MEEIHLRDQQLEKQMEDMKDLLDRLNESKRRDLVSNRQSGISLLIARSDDSGCVLLS